MCQIAILPACAKRILATRFGMASRYGLSDVIALYASATAMTRAMIGMSWPASLSGVTVPDSFVVMTHDLSDFRVAVHLGENPFSNLRMSLHNSALI